MYIAASARRYLQNVSAGHTLESGGLRPNNTVIELMGEGAWSLYVLELFYEQILNQNLLLGLNLE